MPLLNAPADLGLLPERAAESHGDVAFLSDTPWLGSSRQVRTVSDFAVAVAEYAERLWAANIRPGNMVALVKSNHVDIQAVACAAVRIGAIPALLSVMMEPQELLESLRLLERPVLLLDQAGADKLGPHRAELKVLTRGAFSIHAPAAVWAPLLDGTSKHEVARRTEDDPILITHSSGTTGQPKLVMHTAESLYFHAAPQIEVAKNLDTDGLAARCLSFVHVRMSSGLVAMLTVRMPFLALASPELSDVKHNLLTHRPVALETHPNLFLRWERLAADPDRPFASVGRYVTSFDAVHPRTVRTLLHASDHPDPVYFQAYGQTETGPVTILSIRRTDLDAYSDSGSRSVGCAIPGLTSVRVIDEGGMPVANGSPGFIEVRTQGRTPALLGSPALPDADQWWQTGDIGVLNDDGNLELLDRAADRVDGTSSLLRVEDLLLDLLPELVEVVLVAAGATVCTVDDEELDSERWAKACIDAGLSEPTPFTQCRWDELPLTGSWKVRRHRIGAHGGIA